MTKAPLIHVASLIFDEPLAILPEKLHAILGAIGPRLMPSGTGPVFPVSHDGSGNSITMWPNSWGGLFSGSASVNSVTINSSGATVLTPPGDVIPLQAQFDDDEEKEEKPYRLTPEGVAIVPIRGTLMKRNTWISAVSGLSSYASVQKAAQAAVADPQVRGILFDVDSPGGTTHGCFELSDLLYGMRGTKPMWACANDLAASAAYALASAADRLLVTRTAGVGSIGVFALHADQSGFDSQAGVKFTYIFAGDKKTDGNPHEPLSKRAKADIQAEVDREYQMFVQCVTRNRAFAGASVEKIANTEAAVFFAQKAMPLLADEVATFDEALAALTQKITGAAVQSSIKVALKTETSDNAPDPAPAPAPASPAPAPASEHNAAPGTNSLLTVGELNGETVMAKKDDELKPKGAAAAAAEPEPDDDEDDDEKKKPGEEEEGKKGKVTEMPVAASAKRIAELCQIAGAPELAADYIVKGYSLDKVIEKLNARRAKASAENEVHSYVDGTSSGGSGMSVDQAIDQARTMSANSGGTLKPSQCMEKILRSNPQVYNRYLEERGAVAAKVWFTGGGPALNDYVLNEQMRYMRKLGLSTAIETVPGHRAM